jgi:hypothetical protein
MTIIGVPSIAADATPVIELVSPGDRWTLTTASFLERR